VSKVSAWNQSNLSCEFLYKPRGVNCLLAGARIPKAGVEDRTEYSEHHQGVLCVRVAVAEGGEAISNV